MTTEEATLETIAEEAASYFERATRPDGDPFTRLKDDRPEWVYEAVYAAHGGDLLPDDYRYKWSEEAFDAIAEGDTEASDGFEEPDVYTSNLLEWVSSNLSRVGYVDEAVEEFGGEPGGLADQLMLGQAAERREVFEAIFEACEEQLAEREAAEDD